PEHARPLLVLIVRALAVRLRCNDGGLEKPLCRQLGSASFADPEKKRADCRCHKMRRRGPCRFPRGQELARLLQIGGTPANVWRRKTRHTLEACRSPQQHPPRFPCA